MKRLIILTVLILLLAGCRKKETPDTTKPEEVVSENLNTCTVILIKGEVSFKDDKGNSPSIAVGDTLLEGYEVLTGAAAAVELQIGTTTIVRIKEHSHLILNTLFYNQNSEKSELSLELGTILTKSEKLGEESTFEVSTPTLSSGIRGTEFSVVVTRDSSQVYVNEGKVAVVKKIEVKNIAAISARDEETARKITESVRREIIVAPDQKVEVTKTDISNEETGVNKKTGAIEEKLKRGEQVTARDLQDVADTIEVTITRAISENERKQYLPDKELKDLKIRSKSELDKEFKKRREETDKVRKDAQESTDELDKEKKKLNTDATLDIESVNKEAKDKAKDAGAEKDKNLTDKKKKAEDKADNLDNQIKDDLKKDAEDFLEDVEKDVKDKLKDDEDKDTFDF